MRYYDYERVPLEVADAAFADFLKNVDRKSILDLLPVLIERCDAWCAANEAYSEADQRVDVLLRFQAYIHSTYTAELSRLMKASIRQYQQRQAVIARLHERRN
ncbi:MAG: hypothetical protein OHK0015_18770 [Chloroflexi bacterium OHK40]|jgi:hypothetical protein